MDVAVGFATVNLEDDEQLFTPYKAAVSMTPGIYEQYPEIEEILQPLANNLNSDIMHELIFQVDV
ncbi:glycine betaine ABC transporter substrate-binding protein [Radiobacillus sp. PE A8.2]|uniref:glycine betaine ABC transporter substrate-binding protein n=1 Tax=Radiobacillus sp. PE A8.2 TaxID=3380349 RepID=UPI00388E8E9B